jgi:hypothetical protein
VRLTKDVDRDGLRGQGHHADWAARVARQLHGMPTIFSRAAVMTLFWTCAKLEGRDDPTVHGFESNRIAVGSVAMETLITPLLSPK